MSFQLRGDQLASEINQLSTSAEIDKEKGVRNAPEVSEASKIPEASETTDAQESSEAPTEAPDRPLNRKEKRRLQRLQEEKNQTGEGNSAKRIAPEATIVIEAAEIPTGIKKLYW